MSVGGGEEVEGSGTAGGTVDHEGGSPAGADHEDGDSGGLFQGDGAGGGGDCGGFLRRGTKSGVMSVTKC